MKIFNVKKQNDLNKKGFAVLFAILLASFLITLGISIFNISLKEIQIVTSARDSQISYYTADSARECLLYWDIKMGAFPACADKDCNNYLDRNGDLQQAIAPQINVDNIVCNGISTSTVFYKNFLTYSSPLLVNFFQASSTAFSPVADASIKKTYNTVTNRVVTTFEAYGHNTGILGRRVERAIEQINN